MPFTNQSRSAPAPDTTWLLHAQINELLIGALQGAVLPRVLGAAQETLKESLGDAVVGHLHRHLSRELIAKLTAHLSLDLFSGIVASSLRPLAVAASSRIIEHTTPRLASALSLSLANALLHHPSADAYCSLCSAYANSTAAAANGAPAQPPGAASSQKKPATGAKAEGSPPGEGGALAALSGPYCGLCKNVQAHDRILNANVRAVAAAHVLRYVRTDDVEALVAGEIDPFLPKN